MAPARAGTAATIAAIALLVLAAAPGGVYADAASGKISGWGSSAGTADVVPGQYSAAAAAAAAAADDDIAAAAATRPQVPIGDGVGVGGVPSLLLRGDAGDIPLTFAGVGVAGESEVVSGRHYVALSPAAAAAAAADVAAAAAAGPQVPTDDGVGVPSPKLGAEAGDDNPLILPSEGGANGSESGNQTKTRSSHRPVMRLAGLGDGRA
jgi:hypothetical protein